MKVHYTTGSVFHALGFPDADDLVVKSDLVARIERIIRERGPTQVQAATPNLYEDHPLHLRVNTAAPG